MQWYVLLILAIISLLACVSPVIIDYIVGIKKQQEQQKDQHDVEDLLNNRSDKK